MVVIQEQEEENLKRPPSASGVALKGGGDGGVEERADGASSSGVAEIEAEEEEGWETASEGSTADFEESSGGAEGFRLEKDGLGGGREVSDGSLKSSKAVKVLEGGGGSDGSLKVAKSVDELEGGVGKKVSDGSPVEDLEERISALALEELRERALDAANTAKAEGNRLYGEEKFVEALQAYDQGLSGSELKAVGKQLPKDIKEIRSILHSNRAACYVRLDNNDAAVRECTKALDLNPSYVKALVRRAQAREKLTFYEEAMADWNKVLEIEPDMTSAKKSLRQLAPLAEEKREKMKEEMIGKLKEVGNSLLGRFGMSLDNFKSVQDPNTGSYSIQFQR